MRLSTLIAAAQQVGIEHGETVGCGGRVDRIDRERTTRTVDADDLELSVPTEADGVQFAGTLNHPTTKVVAVRWMEAECFFSGLA